MPDLDLPAVATLATRRDLTGVVSWMRESDEKDVPSRRRGRP
jgi:hypothetical protein